MSVKENEVINLLAIGNADGSNSVIAIAENAVAYSKSVKLPKNAYFGLRLRFASPGNVNVQVEQEQGNTEPEDQAADAQWAVPDDVGTLSNAITNKVTHFLRVAPVVSTDWRLKLTGITSGSANDAGTELELAELVIARL